MAQRRKREEERKKASPLSLSLLWESPTEGREFLLVDYLDGGIHTCHRSTVGISSSDMCLNGGSRGIRRDLIADLGGGGDTLG